MGSPDYRYNLFSPYDNSPDCSHEICTFKCRQFCIPPPPPYDDDSDPPFSPLMIVIIAVLVAAFLLVSYYAIVQRYCRRRSAVDTEENTGAELGNNQWRSAAAPGLDEAVIKAITVCKYQKGDGLIEGTECAVCLGEFQDSDALRLLPKCSHAFHLPCIDAWLKSQPNCPLCRANVVAAAAPPPNAAQNSPEFNANAYQIGAPADLILVVDDPGRYQCNRTVVVHHSIGDEDSRNSGQIRRSVSLGSFSSQKKVVISDILKLEDIDESGGDCVSRDIGIGTSRGLFDSPVEMKRSISTGGYDVPIKGKNLMAPY